MNYLVIYLFIAVTTLGRVQGGRLNTSHAKDWNPSNTEAKSHGLSPAPQDNVASGSNQGWSPAAGGSYLPPTPTSSSYRGPLAVPMILPDGTIAETAEVAAARAAHLAALAAARASDPDMGKDDGEYDPRKYGDDLYGVVAHNEDLLQTILSYQDLAKGGGAPAPVYGVPGAGMQSLPKAMSDASAGGAGYGAELNMPYMGPLAMLQLLASGYLEDTPEVVAARATHLKALQEAQAAAALWRAKQAAAGGASPWG